MAYSIPLSSVANDVLEHMSEKIPRLRLDQLEPRLAAYLAPRVERLKYLGEFFRCAGHQPAALLSFMEFTENCKGGLDQKLVELIALSVANRTGNSYERNQHERLSVRLGFGREWVMQVNALAPETATLLSTTEEVVQSYVLAAIDQQGRGAGAKVDGMVDAIGPPCAIAVMMVLGRYLTHSVIVNSLQLEPPVPSIFEDGFSG